MPCARALLSHHFVPLSSGKPSIFCLQFTTISFRLGTRPRTRVRSLSITAVWEPPRDSFVLIAYLPLRTDCLKSAMNDYKHFCQSNQCLCMRIDWRSIYSIFVALCARPSISGERALVCWRALRCCSAADSVDRTARSLLSLRRCPFACALFAAMCYIFMDDKSEPLFGRLPRTETMPLHPAIASVTPASAIAIASVRRTGERWDELASDKSDKREPRSGVVLLAAQ